MEAELSTLDKSKIANEILAYLSDHPDAQDTFEGIVQWWLVEQKIKKEVRIVKQVLAELVRQGLMEEHTSKDSRTFYRISRSAVKKDSTSSKQK